MSGVDRPVPRPPRGRSELPSSLKVLLPANRTRSPGAREDPVDSVAIWCQRLVSVKRGVLRASAPSRLPAIVELAARDELVAVQEAWLRELVVARGQQDQQLRGRTLRRA